MELENLITPYVESLINQSLQEIEPLLDSDNLSNKEDIQTFLEGILTLEGELVSMGGALSPNIKGKINEINDRLSNMATLTVD